MYKVEYKDKTDAFSKIYKFITNPELTKPECTVWQEPNILMTYRRNSRLLTEKNFIKQLSSFDMSAISCVASTDKDDLHRTVLTYYPPLEFMVLSFPLTDKLSAEDKKLIDYMNE